MNEDEYDRTVHGDETIFEWLFGTLVTVGVITVFIVALAVTI